MAMAQVTLRGDDAARFENIKDKIARKRGGAEPSNAETLRLLMDGCDPGDELGPL